MSVREIEGVYPAYKGTRIGINLAPGPIQCVGVEYKNGETGKITREEIEELINSGRVFTDDQQTKIKAFIMCNKSYPGPDEETIREREAERKALELLLNSRNSDAPDEPQQQPFIGGGRKKRRSKKRRSKKRRSKKGRSKKKRSKKKRSKKR